MDARLIVLALAMTLAGCAVIEQAGREYVWAVWGKPVPREAER